MEVTASKEKARCLLAVTKSKANASCLPSHKKATHRLPAVRQAMT